MNDNYYTDDLIASLERDVVMERYYPLLDYKAELTAILCSHGITRKDNVSADVLDDIGRQLWGTVAALFARFIHIYDFNKAKLRDIRAYIGTDEYDALADLLRLPGVRLLRAELYLNSGVTLKVLAESSTEDIRNMVGDYIKRGQRTEITPQPKEVNCHRAVARMLLHADEQ